VKVLYAFGKPRAATTAEIQDVIARHAFAAAAAERAGFDGVQIHGAHGYLLNQFLSPDVNVREDEWGRDLFGRARLLVECVRAARAATTRRFSVLVKLNSGDFLRGGFTEDEALDVVAMLDAEKIDLLEISGGRYESGASFGHASPDPGAREAYFLAFARRAREATSVPIMLTGGLRSRGAMESALDEGALDVVGIARPMALLPDYPRRLLAGEALPKIASRRLGLSALAGLEGAAELAWYYLQVARMGRGTEPEPRISGLHALIWFFAGDACEALRGRAARRIGRPKGPPAAALDGPSHQGG
jgi:2,4-dienoyl-CoA reductase-like NADH-dependent reductase (Old Yellow Enzyme family)